MVIEGSAGVGKSRLAREALELARSEGAFVEWVQATRSTATVAMGAVADLLHGVESETPLGILRGCDQALRERADGRSIVLAVDDGHLLDDQSASLMLHLVMASTAFVIVTVRDGEPCPDAVVSLWKDLGAARMELAPLDERQTGDLLENVLGGPVEHEMRHWAFERSKGNVLYLRELLLGAASDRSLVNEGGLWRLSRIPPASQPLLGLIAERLAGLDDAEARVLEFVALGEPLGLKAAIELVGVDALAAAESRGIVALKDERISLSHPLYGEVAVARMPAARAREVRLAMATAMQGRRPRTPEDALRIVRWLLDAGEEIPPDTLLAAAEAAIGSGDAELGAELARRALSTPDLTRPSLLLARAEILRKRYEEAEQVLAAAEPGLATPAEALEHLEQRIPALYFGLKRSTEAGELLDRAEGWWPDVEWRRGLSALRVHLDALTKGWATAVESAESMLADPELNPEARRGLEAVHAPNLFYAGKQLEAVEFSRRVRPTLPLRDPVDSLAFAGSVLIDALVGDDWPGLEAFASTSLAEAVRLEDHEAAGLAALSLATTAFLQGRQRVAERWIAESELQLERSDSWGMLVVARATAAGIAYANGDPVGAAAALDRTREELGDRDPLPNQAPLLSLAEGWVAAAAGDLPAARKVMVERARATFEPAYATEILHEALRIGEPADGLVELMRAWGAATDGPLSSAYVAHLIALAPPDGEALVACAQMFEQIGALRNAIECAAEAAEAFAAIGDQDAARQAVARARRLHEWLGEGSPPTIEGIDTARVELTAREAEIIELARRGLTNAEIAEQLVLSVRTIESHMYRAMAKLGIGDRRELRALD